MPERANPFVSLVPAAGFLIVAAVVAGTYGFARADSACLERPNQPASEGARWNFRYDRAKGRKCWFLQDASTNLRDVAALPQSQPNVAPTPTLASRLAELFGSLTGPPAIAQPQGDTSHSNPTSAQRKTSGSSAHAAKTENGVRTTSQRDAVEGHTGKRASAAQAQTNPAQTDNEALFEEFMRWHEHQQKVNQLNSSPPP